VAVMQMIATSSPRKPSVCFLACCLVSRT